MELTETTIRYLYATTWLPTEVTTEPLVAVPGGSTRAIDTGANLLHIALWNLRRMRAIELEQVRPVEDENLRVFGGRSFSRFRLLDSTVATRGLEGALLRAAGNLPSREGFLAKRIASASQEDEHGLRRLLRALDLDEKGPWRTVCGHCFAEAQAAGLVAVKGRLFKKIGFTDVEAVKSLRARHDELRSARGAYREAEPELNNAVVSDCLRIMVDGYSPRGGDSL